MKKMSLILITMVTLSINLVHADTVKTPSGFDTGKCTKCHNGNSTDDNASIFPRLEGQTTKYFINAIAAYKSKARHSYDATTLMSKRVNLDAATVTQLADFFNKLPVAAGISGDAAVIATGKDIYSNGIPDRNIDSCVMCHGKEGAGKGVNPRLAGQYKNILVNQLHAYRDGEIEKQDDMKAAAKALTESEMDAVATYLQSL